MAGTVEAVRLVWVTALFEHVAHLVGEDDAGTWGASTRCGRELWRTHWLWREAFSYEARCLRCGRGLPVADVGGEGAAGG